MEDYVESGGSFKIQFFGANKIDATILAMSLTNIVGAVPDITEDLYPEAESTIKVLNVVFTGTGCFEINIDATIRHLPTLFDNDDVEVANEIIGALLDMMIIKKHLCGQPPKEIVTQKDVSQITNQTDESISIPRNTAKLYFKSSVIDNRTSNIFNLLKQDRARDNMRFESSDGTIRIEFETSEFENMAVRVIEGIQETQDVLSHIVDVSLLLKKPDLLGRSKWSFIYDKIIEADIKDYEWLEKVQNGAIKNLYAGVKIPVKLLVEVDLDENKNLVGDPKYFVLQVTGDVIEPPKSESTFDF